MSHSWGSRPRGHTHSRKRDFGPGKVWHHIWTLMAGTLSSLNVMRWDMQVLGSGGNRQELFGWCGFVEFLSGAFLGRNGEPQIQISRRGSNCHRVSLLQSPQKPSGCSRKRGRGNLRKTSENYGTLYSCQVKNRVLFVLCRSLLAFQSDRHALLCSSSTPAYPTWRQNRKRF